MYLKIYRIKLNWYEFLDGELAADFNPEQNNRELISVATAFKKYAIHNRKDAYKFVYCVEHDDLQVFKGVLESNFKFNRFIEYGADDKKDWEPYVYFSPETYINGYSSTGSDYMFTVFTLNKKTTEVINEKFKEALQMDNALK